MSDSPTGAPQGAYGLGFLGLEPEPALLVDSPSHWPAWTIERREGAASAPEAFTASLARVRLQDGGQLTVDRAGGRSVYETPRGISDQAMIHPYLAVTAGVVASWLGRLAFHGAGVAQDDGTWLLLADASSGKSSLAAYLAQRGARIVADDLLVVGGDRVFAGPRCVDLRRDSAAVLGAGEPVGVVGGRDRWRIRTRPVEPETRISGFVALSWADDVEVVPLPAAERLATLYRHLAVITAGTRPEALLALAALPVLRLSRPRDLARLAESGDRLMSAFDQATADLHV